LRVREGDIRINPSFGVPSTRGRWGVDHRTGPLVAWLEGEGERQQRKTPLPPRVGDSARRGWVQVWVGVLGGTLAAGLFVCWLGMAWRVAEQVGAAPAWLTIRTSVLDSLVKTLEGVRVEEVVRDVKPGAPGPLTLIVRHRGVLLPCEFREEKAPREVRVGDSVTIRYAKIRVEKERHRVVLEDCYVVERLRRPGE
jgi:hypothetical protein